MNDLEKVMQSEATRRAFLARMSAAGLGAAAMALLAGCGSGSGTSPIQGTSGLPGAFPTPFPGTTPTPTPSPSATPATRVTDADILNFALNLEYLEAEFYLRAINGNGLSAADSGSNPGAVVGGKAVPFTSDVIRQYAIEIAADEQNHVRFLRSALNSAAVSRPAINFTDTFNVLARLAGLGSTFDPFASQDAFLLGSFVFEDVGVTAFKGAAPLLVNKDYLEAAAGILAVEAYHSGEIRTILFNSGAAAAANAVSGVRASLGGGKDQGVTVGGAENIVPTDANSIAFSRTTSEVLHIVYGTASANAASGGFFPNGVNGTIKVAA